MRTRSRRRASLALASVALAAVLVPVGATAAPNPANDPALLNTPIEDDQYDYAHRCRPRSTPGIRLLTDWVDSHYPGSSWGVFRCERLSKTTRSLHSEGRALDWHLDARNPRERRAAYALIDRLIAPDQLGNGHALARRMGVQEIIFDCQSWFSGAEGLGPYSLCEGKGKIDRTSAHRDHVHIGLNWAGAKAITSFWKSPLVRR